MKLHTADELATLLNVPATWLYRAAREGSIPHVRLGRYVRFDLAAVERWLAEQTTGGRS